MIWAMNQQNPSIKFLDPTKISIYRDENGDLWLKTGVGVEYRIERIVRNFPIALPWRYITLFDENQKEIGTLKDVNQLDNESARILKQELKRVYFIPKITKIYEVKEEYGVLIWNTDTDKGSRTFEVTSRHNIRKIGNNRVIVKDADGNLYDINLKRLDDRSEALIDALT